MAVTTVHHAAIVTHALHSVTVMIVQHAQAAETSVAVTTAHHAAIVTLVHHSVTATTVHHAVTVIHVPHSVAATTVQRAVAMIARAAHAPIHAEVAQPAHVAPPAAARSQHAVTSPSVQSARLD